MPIDFQHMWWNLKYVIVNWSKFVFLRIWVERPFSKFRLVLVHLDIDVSWDMSIGFGSSFSATFLSSFLISSPSAGSVGYVSWLLRPPALLRNLFKRAFVCVGCLEFKSFEYSYSIFSMSLGVHLSLKSVIYLMQFISPNTFENISKSLWPTQSIDCFISPVFTLKQSS